jgi:hypothetical protein
MISRKSPREIRNYPHIIGLRSVTTEEYVRNYFKSNPGRFKESNYLINGKIYIF